MGLYDFSGASMGQIGEDLPVLNPVSTTSGGWIDTGMEFFDGLTDKWLQYESIKSRIDLETQSGMPYGSGYRQPSAVPSWVWLLAAVAGGVVLYRMAR